MPSRLNGTAPSSRQTPSTVNEVVNALQRKLTLNHIETTSSPTPRRPSFSMDSILHPKKDKKQDGNDDRRISLTGRHSNKSKEKLVGRSPRIGAAKPGHFKMIIESPPLVMYGTMANSSGALLSGRLKLVVDDPTRKVRLDKFEMRLNVIISTKKPVGKDCKDCSERIDELKKWTFLSEPKTFEADEDNEFPYSFLLPGDLSATTQSVMGSIQYALIATANTSHGEKITLTHPIIVQRSIYPGPEKTSIRIFPPTNLTGKVQLPPVVHPIGTFPVKMLLNGVVEKKGESSTRWRLRKMMWRIEEQSKVISAPCSKHVHKVSEGKSILHTDTRILGNDELKGGWKSDFDTAGGEITMDFEASLATRGSHKASCDVDAKGQLEVKHNLVIELIVAEEFCPSKNTSLITPTGAARVLRMQFGLIVTERGGMGISWDEEMPPVYEDVPPSPPGYGNADPLVGAQGGAWTEVYHGELQDLPNYEELDSMRDAALTASPGNTGLPMRERPQNVRFDSDEAGPSRRLSPPRRPVGLTNDDLGLDAPQYALRSREETQENREPIEDREEGTASEALQHG
jgi:arrestin-related trafficking adapter 1